MKHNKIFMQTSYSFYDHIDKHFGYMWNMIDRDDDLKGPLVGKIWTKIRDKTNFSLITYVDRQVNQ